MLLTDAERKRFIEYCEQNILSSKAIIGQMEKMKLPETLKKRETTEMLAFMTVLKKLTNVEAQTIKG